MNLLLRERAATVEGGSAGRLEAGQSLAPVVSPFPVAISLDQVVRHRAWCGARAQVLAALDAGNGPILVTGVSGVGKTLLLQELACELSASGADVFLQSRGDAPLAEAAAGTGRRRIVLIDEAKRIDRAALDRLRQFGECAVVLAATSAPGATFGTAGAVVHLAALAADEVGAFVAARLREAGLDADLMTGAAIARLAELSEGIPRALNRLAGAALFLVQVEAAPRVEVGHVDEAAALTDALADWSAISADPSPVAAEPKSISAHAAAVRPAAPKAARTGRVNPYIAAFAAVSVLILFGSLLVGPGGIGDQAGSVKVPEVSPPAMVLDAAQPSAPRDAEPAPVSPHPPVPLAEVGPSPGVAPQPEVPALPPARPAPVETPLPASAPAMVAVRYDRGAADASARAATYAAALRAAGFAVIGPAPAPHGKAKPGARYFFAEDQDTAAAVLKALGLPGGVKLSNPDPGLSPRPGLIELVTPSGETEAGLKPQSPGGGRS